MPTVSLDLMAKDIDPIAIVQSEQPESPEQPEQSSMSLFAISDVTAIAIAIATAIAIAIANGKVLAMEGMPLSRRTTIAATEVVTMRYINCLMQTNAEIER